MYFLNQIFFFLTITAHDFEKQMFVTGLKTTNRVIDIVKPIPEIVQTILSKARSHFSINVFWHSDFLSGFSKPF